MQLELFDWEPDEEGKKCSKCAIVKHLDDFHKDITKKNNIYPSCRHCVSKKDAHKYKNNRDVILERARAYIKKYPEKDRAKVAKRRARKLEATPSWLTKQDFDAIKDVYKEARRLELDKGVPYHVDHIVPLKGRTVCGLHVPWNLQVLAASENYSKSNQLIHGCFTIVSRETF